ECSITAQPQGPGIFDFAPPGIDGVLVVNSLDVALTDLTVTGGVGAPENGNCTAPGYAPSSPGGDGVRVYDGHVALLGVIALGGVGGGPGGQCSQGSESPGGAGLRMFGASRVVAEDSAILGADDTTLSKSPGSGLVITDSGTLVQRGGSISQGSGLPAQ